ncbi:MAG: phage major capsid protein [Terriglobia bacterium]|nr:phage major capsid protein [Terriglobia bacterium]
MEIKEAVLAEVKALEAAVEKFKNEAGADVGDLKDRVRGIEDKLSKSTFGGGSGEFKSAGRTVVESDVFKDFASRGMKETGNISVKSFFTKTAIVNAEGLNQPLVQAYRMPGIVGPGQQRLTIRDLLTVTATNSNMIEYCREASSTNAGAIQGVDSSPAAYENVAKAESAMAFELLNEPVRTLAHWFPISNQVLSDSTALQGYIDGRGRYFLKLKEEDELLNGTGSGGHLNGLIQNATAYDTGYNASGDTYIDTLSHAITQINDSLYEADAIVVNNKDFEKIRLTKTAGTGITSGTYILGDPRIATLPTLWGLPLVSTKSIAEGTFLVGAFQMGAVLWDREQASVAVSREHSDFFVRNMSAVLFEERLSLTVFQSDAFAYGSYPAAS